MGLWILLGLVVVGIALGLLAWTHLRRSELTAFDEPREAPFSERADPTEGQADALARISTLSADGAFGKKRLQALRTQLDTLFDLEDLPVEVRAAGAGHLAGEWVLAPGADPDRRLLYVHGGGFVVGSPKSHRTLTAKLSQLAGAAVLAVDYRLMPEHRRTAGIEDCQTAYRWILENGPDGAAPVQALFVAGDSAGGNLTLMLLAWARDEGLRAADGAVALSPATDMTLRSPTLRANAATDPILRPLAAVFRLPITLLFYGSWLLARIRPDHPSVSPACGDLSNLPPTLVHGSDAEMLVGDGRRWVNKARAAGSPATLQTWPHMVHVWQMFGPELEETREALDEIASFLERCAPRAAKSAENIASQA
ncbi:MAG: alpha/beta hydrolase [Deltaproteobacteria bacterium]|nr:alpha/beta hydrolase [Deltaproteobacteria bacterium]